MNITRFKSGVAELSKVIFTMSLFIDIVRSLSTEKCRPLFRNRLSLPFKYGGLYLSRALGHEARAKIMSHNYSYIERNFNSNFVNNIIQKNKPIWSKVCGDNLYEIFLVQCKHEREGDFSLVFDMNGEALYSLSFSFAPGDLVGFGGENLIFVSCLQGHAYSEAIKTATKDMGDIHATHMLILAVQALANYLGLIVLSVSASAQISIYGKADLEDFKEKYDEMWISSGGVFVDDFCFAIPNIPYQKPISEIKRSHRSRTQKKRKYKMEIYSDILCLLSNELGVKESVQAKIRSYGFVVDRLLPMFILGGMAMSESNVPSTILDVCMAMNETNVSSTIPSLCGMAG